MTDLQAIADSVEIEALRGEFTDAVMANDHDRLASLFTHDRAVRIPAGNIEATGREEIRAMSQRRQALADYFVQTTHPGAIQIDGDTATGRAYLSELLHGRAGSSHLNYFVYHDHYRGPIAPFGRRGRSPAGGRLAAGNGGSHRSSDSHQLG